MVDKKETESFIKLFLHNTGMLENDISINADTIVINGAGFSLRN